MNILYYDAEKISVETISNIFKSIQELYPEVEMIGLPKGLYLDEDVNFDTLYQIRGIIDHAIDERIRSRKNNDMEIPPIDGEPTINSEGMND